MRKIPFTLPGARRRVTPRRRRWPWVPWAAALALVWSVAALVVRSARADEQPPFRVIVNPDNPTAAAGRDLLSDVFLKTTTRWSDGEPIRPVDQRAESAVRQAFSETILRRSVSAVRSYWQQRIFSGRDVPPPELESDDKVVDFVLQHRGGVGYVSLAAKTRQAKVVAFQ